MYNFIKNLSAHPLASIFSSVFIFFIGTNVNYLLLDSLLKMHRSKSALEKLKKEYTFLQRLGFLHFKGNCRHAVKFCNSMIIFQKSGWICFAVYLFAVLLFAFDFFSADTISWLSVVIFLYFGLPSLVINWALGRPLLYGRFKKYSFEKYHNTNNHKSIF